MKKLGILLIQLGSPKSPEVSDVKAYLKEFLGDPRVVDNQSLLWKIVLNLFILPSRSPKSAKAYNAIWTGETFPLFLHTEAFATKCPVFFFRHHDTPATRRTRIDRKRRGDVRFIRHSTLKPFSNIRPAKVVTYDSQGSTQVLVLSVISYRQTSSCNAGTSRFEIVLGGRISFSGGGILQTGDSSSPPGSWSPSGGR